MRKLDVKQADLTVEVRFALPAFSLLRVEAQQFIEVVYMALVRYGITPNDITYGQTGSLADRHVFFGLPRIGAGLRLSVARLEIGFNDLSRVDFQDIALISNSAFDGLARSKVSAAALGEYAITLNAHAVVDNGEALEFLQPYLGKSPDGLGASTGGAGGFYYGAEGPRKTLSIIMDGSAIFPRAVYFRVTSSFDSQQLPTTRLVDLAQDALRRVFVALDLEPPTPGLNK